jgi:hypothetical protein
VAVEDLGRRVERWVAAGVIGREQGDAILALEGASTEATGAAGGRRAVVVEVLGYLGGGLAVAVAVLVAGSALRRNVLLGIGAAAMVVFLAQAAGRYWEDLGAPLAILLVGLWAWSRRRWSWPGCDRPVDRRARPDVNGAPPGRRRPVLAGQVTGAGWVSPGPPSGR